MTTHPREVIVFRRKWQLAFTDKIRAGRDGECDAPDQPGKAMRIRPALYGAECLETILHESHHAAAWDVFDEDFVTELARDQSRIILLPEVMRHIGIQWRRRP